MDVTATVNPGTACTANLSDTELAYGDISTSQLNQGKPTALPPKPLTLSVACAPFASKFFFRVIDRNLDMPNAPEDLAPVAGVPGHVSMFGMSLGRTPDQRHIGQVFLKSTSIRADERDQIILVSGGGGGSAVGHDWQKRRSDFFFGESSGLDRYIVADPSSLVTTAARNFTIQMEAIPVISAAALGGLSNDAQIDGKFTIEITQL
jgi:hypothetical protein